MPGTGYVVCSAHPRLVDGKPSKNPRYLQTRPDLLDPTARYIAERGMRLARGDPGRPAAARARRRGAGRPAQQSARPRGRHPPPGGLRPDPLPGAARAVHGLHLLADRQEPLDDRGRLRRGADQGPVQRPAADRRPERRPGLLHPHRPGRLLHGRRATSARRCGSITTSAC